MASGLGIKMIRIKVRIISPVWIISALWHVLTLVYIYISVKLLLVLKENEK